MRSFVALGMVLAASTVNAQTITLSCTGTTTITSRYDQTKQPDRYSVIVDADNHKLILNGAELRTGSSNDATVRAAPMNDRRLGVMLDRISGKLTVMEDDKKDHIYEFEGVCKPAQ